MRRGSIFRSLVIVGLNAFYPRSVESFYQDHIFIENVAESGIRLSGLLERDLGKFREFAAALLQDERLKS